VYKSLPASLATLLGPGTAANWGSLLGNFQAFGPIGQAFGLGNALAPFGAVGNGALDLTSTLAPTTTAAGAKGVTSPAVCANAACTAYKQYIIDPATGNAQRNLGDTSDAVTGTLGLQWDPAEGTMAYARYSRGYKAFGLSAGSFLAAPEAAPETVNAYEIGFKKNFGRTLQVNAAVYYLDYANLQAPVTVTLPGSAIHVNQFTNIAKSRSDGVELDMIWQPIAPLRLTLDYSYDDTSIRKSVTLVDVYDNVNTNPISIVGNSLPQAPKNKVAVNGTYSFFTDAGTLTLGASYLYRDKAYAGVFSRDYYSSPSWDQIDLRAVWAAKNNKYTVIAYVKNVGDTAGYDAAVVPLSTNSTFANGARNLELTPPRTYGLELQYRFF